MAIERLAVAFGDFNGDGLTDVFVTNDSVPNFLFENLGNGKFKEVALEKGVAYAVHGNAIAGMGADFRDFDDDGLEDIVLDGMYFETFPLYRNVGPPRFFADETGSSRLASATQELTGWSLGMFDFDNDGRKDLFFAASHFPGSGPRGSTNAPLPNRVLRNMGSGWFDDVSALAGRDFQIPALHHGAAFADFDNDGRIDVVVTAINSYAKVFSQHQPGPRTLDRTSSGGNTEQPGRTRRQGAPDAAKRRRPIQSRHNCRGLRLIQRATSAFRTGPVRGNERDSNPLAQRPRASVERDNRRPCPHDKGAFELKLSAGRTRTERGLRRWPHTAGRPPYT